MSIHSQSEQIKTTVEAVRTFDAMGIKDELLRSIYTFGYQTPSDIQQRAIVPLMQGRNVIAQASRHTGKTIAHAIAKLQRIEVEKKICQAIILAPTRDIALQIQEFVKNLSQYLDIDVFACIGGTSVRETIEILKRGVHIVVGTPGRVVDMIESGVIDPNPIKTLILDDVDEILSKGFKDQMYTILKALPTSVQVGMFSATMTISPDVLHLTEKFMMNPVKILTSNKEELTLEGIKQFYIDVNKEDYKIDTLVDLYQRILVNQSVIFCNSKQRVEWIQRKLTSHNYPVSVVHGDMPMEERNKMLTEFRQGSTRILITTDLLARGIDIRPVSLVINFDMSISDESYYHCTTTTVGFGRKGVAINFITSEEMERINTLQEKYKTKIVPLPKNFMDYL